MNGILSGFDLASRSAREAFWDHAGRDFSGAQVQRATAFGESALHVPLQHWSVTFDFYNASTGPAFAMAGVAGAFFAGALGWRTRARVEFDNRRRVKFALRHKSGDGVFDDFARLKGREHSSMLRLPGARDNQAFILKSNASPFVRQLLHGPGAKSSLLALYPSLFTVQSPSLFAPLLPPPLQRFAGTPNFSLLLECDRPLRDSTQLRAVCALFASVLPQLEARS